MTTKHILENRDRLGFDADGVQGKWFDGEYLPAFRGFDAAFASWADPAERSRVKMVVLEDAERRYKKIYRELYNGFLKRNPLVHNADLAEMGLPSRVQQGRGPTPPPDTRVLASVRLAGPGEIIIEYYDEGLRGRAKPAGVRGAEIAWAVRDTPPVDWSDLVHSSFCSRAPFRLTFERHLRGQILYFAPRWENTVGEKGPWNEIYNVVIP
jgi:hypothetical protein